MCGVHQRRGCESIVTPTACTARRATFDTSASPRRRLLTMAALPTTAAGGPAAGAGSVVGGTAGGNASGDGGATAGASVVDVAYLNTVELLPNEDNYLYDAGMSVIVRPGMRTIAVGKPSTALAERARVVAEVKAERARMAAMKQFGVWDGVRSAVARVAGARWLAVPTFPPRLARRRHPIR